MRRKPPRRETRRKDAKRAGLAPVEVALALPLLCLLVWTLIEVAVVSVALGGAQFEARRLAWRDRHQPASRERLRVGATASFERILLPNDPNSAEGGLLRGEAEVAATPRLLGWLGLRGRAYRAHSLFAGTWDARSLSFEGPERHRPLTLDARAGRFVQDHSHLTPLQRAEP